MKALLSIASLTLALLFVGGCKKDIIQDGLEDSLAWNDSIGGSYRLYGLAHYTVGNVSHTDTLEKILNVVIVDDSTINVNMQGSVYQKDIRIMSLSQDSSTYYLLETGSGFHRYNLKFINNSIDSVYYTSSSSGLSGGGSERLAGVRIP